MTQHHDTTTTASGGAATTPSVPPPPPKPDPTPLNPPVMYYNQKWSVPGIMVTTQEQADALDPSEWIPTTASPAAAQQGGASAEQYPKLYANINVLPVIVGNAAEEKALSSEYKEFTLPDPLCKAAEANNAAKAKAGSVKTQSQQHTPPHHG